MEGESPPCNPNIWPSTSAVTGKKSNKSVKYFHALGFPYFLKHSS